MKSQLIKTETHECLMKCLAEKVGTPEAFMNVSFAPDFEKFAPDVAGCDVASCLAKLIEVLETNPKTPLSSLKDLGAIGNRVVSGGEFFACTTVINDDVMDKLVVCEELAPLHNPPAVACIAMMRKLLPDTPQTAVFDTAFHTTMPAKAYRYALPTRYYDKYRIRRYGAHGTSHAYATETVAAMMGKSPADINVITCHLGNGGSITAVEGGKSVDTSMGFTPLEGLIMGTRCGSIDPAVVTSIMRRDDIGPDEVDRIMNKESGILGITGGTSDMRDVQAAAEAGDEASALALDMYAYSVKKLIGGYYAILPRTDAVVMTAGIGENSAYIRELIFSGLEHLGMKLDSERNNAGGGRGDDRKISADDSPVAIYVICADEEARIANETEAAVNAL